MMNGIWRGHWHHWHQPGSHGGDPTCTWQSKWPGSKSESESKVKVKVQNNWIKKSLKNPPKYKSCKYDIAYFCWHQQILIPINIYQKWQHTFVDSKKVATSWKISEPRRRDSSLYFPNPEQEHVMIAWCSLQRCVQRSIHPTKSQSHIQLLEYPILPSRRMCPSQKSRVAAQAQAGLRQHLSPLASLNRSG